MRNWLASVRPIQPPLRVAETAETAETPFIGRGRRLSAITAITATEVEAAERAAIIEYDGGVPRVLAGALACMETQTGPSWCKAKRWQAALDAFAHIIEDGTASRTLAAGWELRELIGVSRTPPHDAPHRAGLVFSLRPGDRVEAVRRTGCTIVADGLRHTWLRCPLPSDNSIRLPWEL